MAKDKTNEVVKETTQEQLKAQVEVGNKHSTEQADNETVPTIGTQETTGDSGILENEPKSEQVDEDQDGTAQETKLSEKESVSGTKTSEETGNNGILLSNPKTKQADEDQDDADSNTELLKKEALSLMKKHNVKEIWRSKESGYWFTRKDYADDYVKKNGTLEHYKL